MDIFADENEVLCQTDGSSIAGILINGKNGFCMGISYRAETEYDIPDVHEDQEGFYVLAGTGMAKVGDDEFSIRPGVSFLVLKGVSHSIKRDVGSEPLKLLYTHGAV